MLTSSFSRRRDERRSRYGRAGSRECSALGQRREVERSRKWRRIVVSVYLQLRNEAGLRTLVRNLYTPGNPQYRQFLTPAQYHAAYSPAASDVNAVKNFLSQRGLSVGYSLANAMYVDATGTIAQFRAFSPLAKTCTTTKAKACEPTPRRPRFRIRCLRSSPSSAASTRATR